jgi:hypothetical protein
MIKLHPDEALQRFPACKMKKHKNPDCLRN